MAAAEVVVVEAAVEVVGQVVAEVAVEVAVVEVLTQTLLMPLTRTKVIHRNSWVTWVPVQVQLKVEWAQLVAAVEAAAGEVAAVEVAAVEVAVVEVAAEAVVARPVLQDRVADQAHFLVAAPVVDQAVDQVEEALIQTSLTSRWCHKHQWQIHHSLCQDPAMEAVRQWVVCQEEVAAAAQEVVPAAVQAAEVAVRVVEVAAGVAWVVEAAAWEAVVAVWAAAVVAQEVEVDLEARRDLGPGQARIAHPARWQTQWAWWIWEVARAAEVPTWEVLIQMPSTNSWCRAISLIQASSWVGESNLKQKIWNYQYHLNKHTNNF